MGRVFIRYERDRVDYSLTKEELENLKNACNSHWKDFSLTSLAIGIPCTINAVSEMTSQETFQPNLALNLNLVFGVMGIALSMVFLIIWRIKKKNLNDIIKQIKRKPKLDLTPLMANASKKKDTQHSGSRLMKSNHLP